MARRTNKTSVVAADAQTDPVRENILSVATAEFADLGFAGARIDEIAARTATSKRMIYYHFGSKEALYRAVLGRAYAKVRAAERIASLDRMSPVEALGRLVEITLDYHADHPDFVRLVMDENIRRGGQIETIEGMAGGNRSILSILSSILQRGESDGVFRKGLAPLDIHLAISALAFYPVSNRYTLQTNFGRDMGAADARQAHRATAVDLMLRYCMADSQAAVAAASS